MRKKILRLNLYTFFNLPSAWWSGVRVTSFDDNLAEVSVRHRWVNQNPFGSIFWAIQGMAAELSTAILVMNEIRKTGYSVSMLVINNSANFKKKAKGLIKFECNQGAEVAKIVESAIINDEAKRITLKSVGKDSSGNEVSAFDFQWTIKRKKNG